MFKFLLEIFGICRHHRTTFPQAPRGGGQTTEKCLDCGREFEYNWQAMKRGREIRPTLDRKEVQS